MEEKPNSMALSLKINHAILIDERFSSSGIREIIHDEMVNSPCGFSINFRVEKEGRFSTFNLALENCGQDPVKITDFNVGRLRLKNLGFVLKPGESFAVADQLTYHPRSANSHRLEIFLEFESSKLLNTT